MNDQLKLALKGVKKPRSKPEHPEGHLQMACVRWFRMEAKYKRYLLFHIPNGGQMSELQRKIGGRMGTTAGVADLFLMIACKGFHGLFIEMKSAKGKQSPTQIEFEKYCIFAGYKYSICRSIDEFMNVVNEYLK